MVRAVIFDFFGVLTNDQYSDWLHSRHLERNGVYAEVSHDADLDEITMKQFFSRLASLTKASVPVVETEFRSTMIIRPGIVALARQLRSRGYPLGLLSNSNGPWLRDLLRQHELERLFDVIVISGEVGLVKPQPEIFALTLDQLKVAPNEAVFIDDRPDNVTAAAAAGIQAILYKSETELKAQLAELTSDRSP